MQKKLLYQSSEISYHVFGNGGEVVFCFHGYGLDGSSFTVFEKSIVDSATLICIDFPFHGKTIWNEGLLFSPIDLIAIFEILNPFPQKKYTIIGYSMGGRVALNLLQVNPISIKKAILIAPDGLTTHFWQYLSTQTIWGNRLFRFTMKFPQWLLLMVNIGSSLRLLNRSIVKFVHHHIDSKVERDLLYNRWTTMRDFTTNLSRIKKLIEVNQIPINIFTGKFDRVITTSQGQKFRNNQVLITLTEFHCGHQLLKEQWAIEIMKNL